MITPCSIFVTRPLVMRPLHFFDICISLSTRKTKSGLTFVSACLVNKFVLTKQGVKVAANTKQALQKGITLAGFSVCVENKTAYVIVIASEILHETIVIGATE